uniref:Cytochrome P450 n=1 Tax=Kalanchoe fedtschenkoi TaxID=63787 RepID=A0A7N0U8F0_KALFE
MDPIAATHALAWLAVASLLLLSAIFGRRSKRQVNLPPGPKPWPIIGNLNLIGPLPHRSIHQLAQRYGPIMHLRFGSFPVTVASSLEMSKAFLKTHDVALADRPKPASGKYTNYNFKNITWSDYGPYWRQIRKICLMELFSAKRMSSYEHIRKEEMLALMNNLYTSCTRDKQQPIVIKDRISTLSLNVISRMVVGKKYMVDTEDAIISPDDFKRMLDELFILSGVYNIGDSIPWLDFLDLQGYVKRMKKLGVKLDNFLEHVMNEHTERRQRLKEKFVASDMMDVLLEFADNPDLEVKLGRDNIKAFTQDLLAGGTESPSVLGEWVLTEILRKPEIFKSATEELDRVVGKERWVEENDIQNLPYVRAIVRELMRLHPVAPMLVPRLAREDIKVAGYDILKGTRILVNTATIQKDPKLWDNPNDFCPERFIGKSIDVKGCDYELLPFGAGRRICPGYPLGLVLVESSLANLLHGFDWKLPPNTKPQDLDMEEVFGLSTPKKIPLEVVIEPRLPAHLYNI